MEAFRPLPNTFTWNEVALPQPVIHGLVVSPQPIDLQPLRNRATFKSPVILGFILLDDHAYETRFLGVRNSAISSLVAAPCDT